MKRLALFCSFLAITALLFGCGSGGSSSTAATGGGTVVVSGSVGDG